MAASGVERELKLTVDGLALLDALARAERLGPFELSPVREERQINSFFDSRARALRAARLGFRRRVIAGQRLATWTLKGEGSMRDGIANHAEEEVHLDADTAPILALNVLAQAGQAHNNAVLADVVRDALARGGPPLAQPVLETRTLRRVRDMAAAEHGWHAELALDEVTLVGHRGYHHEEIEVELKRGDDAALEAARAAILALGPATASSTSKLSRALAHAESCAGC